MGTFTGIKINTKNILFKFHVVSIILRVRPSHQKSDAKSVFFMPEIYGLCGGLVIQSPPIEFEVI